MAIIICQQQPDHPRESLARQWFEMPRKIRELIRDLERAGFNNRGGKGSHGNFVHPKVRRTVVVTGKAGDDAKQYQEKAVERAIEESQS
jgi:predicted RNA binding protein YcfA (HicA-like mRNA interferase family)